MKHSVMDYLKRFGNGLKNLWERMKKHGFVETVKGLSMRFVNIAWEAARLMPGATAIIFGGMSFICMLYLVWIGGMTTYGFWMCLQASGMMAGWYTIIAAPITWLVTTAGVFIWDLVVDTYVMGEFPIEVLESAE